MSPNYRDQQSLKGLQNSNTAGKSYLDLQKSGNPSENNWLNELKIQSMGGPNLEKSSQPLKREHSSNNFKSSPASAHPLTPYSQQHQLELQRDQKRNSVEQQYYTQQNGTTSHHPQNRSSYQNPAGLSNPLTKSKLNLSSTNSLDNNSPLIKNPEDNLYLQNYYSYNRTGEPSNPNNPTQQSCQQQQYQQQQQ